MQQLKKTVLAQVAGGVAQAASSGSATLNSDGYLMDVVSFGDDGGGGWDGGGWGGGNDMGETGSSNNNVLASVGNGQAVGQFDANGVGPTSCVVVMPPAAPSTPGVFAMSLTESIGAGTAAVGVVAGVYQGVGASLAIEAAGGLSGVGAMGSGAGGLMGSAGLGVGSAAVAGYAVGTIAYYNSETVQDVSQAVVGRVIEVTPEIPGGIGDALMDTFNGKNLGRAGVGP